MQYNQSTVKRSKYDWEGGARTVPRCDVVASRPCSPPLRTGI
jgi:hypothetical protein